MSFPSAMPFSFWSLFEGGIAGLFAWRALPVTVVLVANLIAASIFQRPFRPGLWKNEYSLMLLNIFLIPLMSLVGHIGGIDPDITPIPQANPVAVWAVNGLFIASILLGFFWTFRMKRLRWFASAFGLLQLWIMMLVGFVAQMSIHNDWV